MYSFPSFEPVCSSMSGSNYQFLTCIQISQEAGKVVLYFHLLKNFPQFVVIHTDKGVSVVNEADVFLEFSWFFHDRMNVGNLIPGCFAFSWASLVAQRLKHLPVMWETRVRSLGREDALEKEMAIHPFSCLENPMDREAWWTTVPGVTKSQTQLSDFTLMWFNMLIYTESIRIFPNLLIYNFFFPWSTVFHSTFFGKLCLESWE